MPSWSSAVPGDHGCWGGLPAVVRRRLPDRDGGPRIGGPRVGRPTDRPPQDRPPHLRRSQDVQNSKN